MKVLLPFLFVSSALVGLGQSPIDTEETVTIGGIKQYIAITGKDRSLPLLLFLHGGPGGSVMGYADRFTDKLREHFVVIQWDQRETGRTLALNASPAPLSLSLFQRDTRELVDLLLKRFGRQKMYLAGHSWGTALGFYMVRSYPQKLYAFIAIGPMIDQLESERTALAMMRQRASSARNEVEMKELSSVRIPFQNGEQLFYHRKWLLKLSGSNRVLTEKSVVEWADRWLEVFNEASEDNLFKSLPVIACPVYFFLGRSDYQTNSAIADAYYRQVVAPKKALCWFHCAHSIPFSSPERMQQLLIEKVLPETFFVSGEKHIPHQASVGHADDDSPE